MKSENVKFNIKYVLFLTMVAAMRDLLFGYDWVVIGGAKPFYERFFNIAEIELSGNRIANWNKIINNSLK